MKLNDLISTSEFYKALYGGAYEVTKDYGTFIKSAANIDDIFIALKMMGIKSVKVDLDTMLLIARFCMPVVLQYHRVTEDYSNGEWNALKIIEEGLVKSYFGVKLILE